MFVCATVFLRLAEMETWIQVKVAMMEIVTQGMVVPQLVQPNPVGLARAIQVFVCDSLPVEDAVMIMWI